MSLNLKDDIMRVTAASKKPNPNFRPPATTGRNLCIKSKTGNGFYVRCDVGLVLVFDAYYYNAVNFCPYCGCILKVVNE